MRYEIDLEERPTLIKFKVDVQSPQLITIVGYDPDPKHPNTVYFARTARVRKGEPIEIPMPISPKKLILEINQEKGQSFGNYMNVFDLVVLDLPSATVAFPPKTMEFYNFLKKFAKEAGYIEPGFYVSKDEEYLIWAKENLDADGTPARVNRRTGTVKMNLSKLREYTVFMRVFIGMHEFFHYALQTTDEVSADMGAARVYIGMGYPKSEANYSMTKIFDNSPSALKRVEILDNYIKQNDSGYNKKHNAYAYK
jgi:hypothetical protein